jgi:hypothetical protein
MNFRKALAGILALLCVSCSTGPTTRSASEGGSLVQQAAIGRAFLDSGDFASAAGFLRPLAQAGVADAQFNMGVIYSACIAALS